MRFETVAKIPLHLGLLALIATASIASPARAGAGEEPADPVANAQATPPAPAPAPAAASWQPVVSGRLDNGVRFAILPRQGNEPGIGLLMRNEGGFIEERRPGERGLTHLIEHIAFASPTLKAPDDRNHLPKLGLPLTLPAPSAGTTSWRETNYFLSTRTTRTADLDTLLGLFREVATDLIFRADAVDEQRADVMREMGERKLGNDIYASYIAAVAPGSPTDLIDAQNADDVPTASIATIRALYNRLYRPENMMIVIVGNVDPARAKALISDHFGTWTHDGPPAVHVPVAGFRADRIAPISASSLATGRRTAMLTVATPTPPPLTSRREQMDAALMDMLAIRAVGGRLTAAQPNSPPGKVGIYIENGEQGHRLILLWDNFAGAAWGPAIAGLGRATCALDTTGFTAAEWDSAKRGVIEDLEQQAAAMRQVANVELAKDLSHAIAAGRALIPPDSLLQHARAWLPTVDLRTGNAWWRQQWHAGVRHIRVEAPELAQVADPARAIRASVDEATASASCRVRR